MNVTLDFVEAFKALTGNAAGPFPWQTSLFRDWFSQGRTPASCTLPTGMGKTSLVALWLLALGQGAHLPRRLVYVVNRRTVVDQTTTEVEKLRENLSRVHLPGVSTLAISTLRGQFADNRAWSADPSRPAVITGTVDMIGSRLLFSGYGIGKKAKPLHAGFIGQDALIVHDEAHLEPAFQSLLESIVAEQERCRDSAPIRVIALSATTRYAKEMFGLTTEERNPPHDIKGSPEDDSPLHTVWRRLKATKKLQLTEAEDECKEIGRVAAAYQDRQVAVVVYVRTVEAVMKVYEILGKTKRPVCLLTGTIRGRERDSLVGTVEFQRFLKGATPGETVYLICTSAGEVGIDISADHMVCDLSPFDSMAQRFGRVNRYGLRSDSEITVVHSNKFDEKASGPARKLTLEILTQLNGDASPRALSDLRGLPNIAGKIEHAFTPQPEIPRVSDILFDAWSLTSITKPLPGRPPVAPYLHGIAEWQPPETHVAWREEIDNVTGDLLSRHPAKDLLDDFPLLPHELLRDRSDRVLKQLQILAKRIPQVKAWLLSGDGGVEQVVLAELVSAKNAKDEIADKTVVLPPSAGGLDEQGMLDGDAELASDAAENQNRQRIWDGEVPVGMVIVREIDTRPDADSTTDEARGRRFWLWCERPQEGGRSGPRSVHWDAHVGNVVERAKQIVASLALPPPLDRAVIVAAQLHDHGKRREQFQRTLGNRDYPNVLLAKSNCRGTARLPEPFRHEFASVFDAENDSEFLALNEEMRDLALHMIAAHHGRARPHFDPGEGFDPDRTTAEAEGLRSEVPRRFARLQRRYGRWGLAYLESLLRAADWAASAEEAQHL